MLARGPLKVAPWHWPQPMVIIVTWPGGAPAGTGVRHGPIVGGFGSEPKYAARSAASLSLTWLSTKAGMIPQGWRTARITWATFNPRPARSGPKAPSALLPWQLRHAVALGAARSQ